jgi:hypothetical protein
MLDRHRLAHAGLGAVYAVTAVILTLEGAPAHAICALAAALIYLACAVALPTTSAPVTTEPTVTARVDKRSRFRSH